MGKLVIARTRIPGDPDQRANSIVVRGAFRAPSRKRVDSLRRIPKDANSELHLSFLARAWNRFYKKHPKATEAEIRHCADLLDRWVGRNSNPPVMP